MSSPAMHYKNIITMDLFTPEHLGYVYPAIFFKYARWASVKGLSKSTE